jgi:hypothetical protein
MPHGILDKRVYGGIEEDTFLSSHCPGLAAPWPSQTQVAAHGLAAQESTDDS